MRIRYLFGLSIICAVIGVGGLRHNHQKALLLRDQVISQDQAGQPVAENLEALRRFVFKHMNSSMRVELKYSYDRAVEKAQAAAQNNSNDNIYSEAQATCDRAGVSSVEQAQCVQRFLEGRLTTANTASPLELPDKSRYTYAFVAPAWTPDLAGFGLAGAVVLALASIWLYLRKLFKK